MIIRTKYLGPTNTKGSRIKVISGRESAIVPWDSSKNTEENLRAAVIALCQNLGCHGTLQGEDDIFVLLNEGRQFTV